MSKKGKIDADAWYEAYKKEHQDEFDTAVQELYDAFDAAYDLAEEVGFDEDLPELLDLGFDVNIIDEEIK